MAVIINDIDLPKHCGVCPLSYYDSEDIDLWCPYFNSTMNQFQDQRYEHCPMVRAYTRDEFVYQALYGEEAENE